MRKYLLSCIFAGVSVIFLLTEVKSFAAASLNDYWHGKADWKYITRWSENSLGGHTLIDGIHIEVVGNDWYLFTRTQPYPGWPKWGTEVRRSTDKGLNWGNPVEIIGPQDGTPWEYVASDGQPFFDGSRWHYVFQCKNTAPDQGEWKGCYARSKGDDPMGEWEITGSPIITPNSLWGPICDSKNDHCNKQVSGDKVYDEGTFGTFLKDGIFWISFHGHAGSSSKSFRGLVNVPKENIATPAPSGWNVGTNGAPTDAILDYLDAKSWREDWGSSLIGPGHGSILEDGGYYYIFPEMVNNDLGGGLISGQKWDVGLLRTTNLASTKWEQLKDSTGEYQNPVLYSTYPPSKTKGQTTQTLTIQYPRLFKDGTDIYMIVARNHCDYDHINPDDGAGECDGFKNKEASAIYLYRLEDSSRNILKNADFWIPAPYDTYWKQYQSAMAIYRNYTLSSDGNQAMEFNCGAACQDGASIYQEVDVSAHPKESFTFGGKFRVAHDGVGELQVAVHQLRADGSLVISHSTPVTVVGAAYQDLAGTGSDVTIRAETKTLRYELYPKTAGVNFRADELYLNLGGSVNSKPVLPSTKPSPLEWDMSAPTIGHVIGRADSGGWSANVAQDAPGFLQFGPYVTALGAGQHTAFWNLSIDNNRGSDHVAQLQIYDASDGQVLAWSNLERDAWRSPFVSQKFELPFFLSGARAGHALEFRVWWFGAAYVREERVGVRPFTAKPASRPTASCANMTPISWTMFSSSIRHAIGRRDNEGWSANTLYDQAGYLQFGPYVKTLDSEGTYTASWRLMIDNNRTGSDKVARIEVADFDDGQRILASRELRRNAWNRPFTYQNFDLSFTIDARRSRHALEFRLLWRDRAYLREQTVSVRCSSMPEPTPTPESEFTPTPWAEPTPPPGTEPTPLPNPTRTPGVEPSPQPSVCGTDDAEAGWYFVYQVGSPGLCGGLIGTPWIGGDTAKVEVEFRNGIRPASAWCVPSRARLSIVPENGHWYYTCTLSPAGNDQVYAQWRW